MASRQNHVDSTHFEQQSQFYVIDITVIIFIYDFENLLVFLHLLLGKFIILG